MHLEQENQAQQHKRRVRYKGKYPKKFEEKYKELQPEKYQDTVQHVIRKGNTPAGMHISIMVKEILDFLQIQPGETGFDATLGYGGHTKAMLECLHGEGHMYATDVDPEESAKTKKRLEELGYGEDILSIRLQNFCTIDEIAKEVGGFDFILADLGVSSMQIDNPKRGFSFKVDGPLDLRLNQEKGISAAERLDTISREELAGMLYENSDEPYCEELAKAITEEIRRGNRIDTTTKLRGVIERALDFLPGKDKQETVKKTCQRTFQALRIDVNHEFEVLYEFMEKLPGALKPGGRVAILTFHSGEDRLVKQALKEGYREGIYSDYAKDVIRPSAQDVHRTDARVRRKCAGRCVQSEGMEMIMEEKDTELRDEGLRGNEKIEEAIAGLQQEPTQEMLAHALTVVRRRMKENGQLIVAVEPPAGGGQLLLQTVKTSDSKLWWAAFTGFEEELRGSDRVKSTFLADMGQLFATALQADGVEGIILNPWNRTLMLEKELIRIILGQQG